MRRPLSLRDRVTLASAVALAVALVLLTIGVRVLIAHRLVADESDVLTERIDAQLATLEFGPGNRISVRDAADDEELDRQVWVFDDAGRIVQRASATDDVQRAVIELVRARESGERSVDERVRLRAEPIVDEHGVRRGTLVAGLTLSPYEDTKHVVEIALVVIDVVVLLAGTLLVRAAVTRALTPVAEMTERAADWSEHDLDRRFDLGPPHDELTALSATLDGLLARIGSSMRHEQRFSAEVAHELRTPLAGVRGEAELALNDKDMNPRTRDAFEAILRGTERMESVIDTLLAAARGQQGDDSCDAAGAADTAAAAVRAHADQEGIDLALSGPATPARVGADRDLVAQALQPLLDNAVRHARRRVDLTVERVNGDVVFGVVDDGAGLDPDLADPFEPGASTAGGAGLGLPLARRLARSCGGDVIAAGGARFELRLPAVV